MMQYACTIRRAYWSHRSSVEKVVTTWRSQSDLSVILARPIRSVCEEALKVHSLGITNTSNPSKPTNLERGNLFIRLDTRVSNRLIIQSMTKGQRFLRSDWSS